jgi:hypothetical protein
MTKLEMAALALAAEVESNIKVGVPVTTALVLTLNKFKIAQFETDREIAADLEALYKQVTEPNRI